MPSIWNMSNKFEYMIGEMLPAGKDTILEIDKVVEAVVDVKDKKEKMPIVKFKKAKRPLLLNSRTIIRQIIKAVGTAETDDWKGVSIALYRDEVKAFGDTHTVVRVRDKLPKQPKKPAKKVADPVANSENSDIESSIVLQADMLGSSKYGDRWPEVLSGVLSDYGVLDLSAMDDSDLQAFLKDLSGKEPKQGALIPDSAASNGAHS